MMGQGFDAATHTEPELTDIPDRVVLLGTKGGPAIRPGGPMPTSSLIQIGGRLCVVDCGLGVTKGLVEAGVSLKALDLIFITHLHSDHVLELGPLLHTAWTTGLATPVTVFGPPGTSALWEGFCASLSYDIDLRIADEGRPDLRTLAQVVEYGPGPLPLVQGSTQATTDADALRVCALSVEHPPVTDCFALRFDTEPLSVTFSSDTAFFPPLIEFAKGCDLLVHEAMLVEGVDRLVQKTGNGARLKAHILRSHTEAGDAARIAQGAGVGTLALHHLVPADDPAFTVEHWRNATETLFTGPILIGHDGMQVWPPLPPPSQS